MKIAVTYADGMIFQHFGHTQQFKVYEVENGAIVSSEVVDTNGSGHGALAGLLSGLHADVLICGGIGGGAQMALKDAGIKLYGGCRGNADGFAICNTENALITDCFVRTADDEFEVKALGGEMGSNNITFANCVAWGGYARCFGICGETSNPITNVTFRDSAVIYRDGVWDNDRIGSLVVVAEQCDGSIDGVLFENIEIFRDEGRPILVNIYDEEKENFKMNNIVYKNITCTAYMPSKIEGNASDTNTVQVRLENVTANSKLLTEEGRWLEIGGSCEVNFG